MAHFNGFTDSELMNIEESFAQSISLSDEARKKKNSKSKGAKVTFQEVPEDAKLSSSAKDEIQTMTEEFYGFNKSDVKSLNGESQPKKISPVEEAREPNKEVVEVEDKRSTRRETLIIDGPNEIRVQLTEKKFETSTANEPKPILLQSNNIDKVPKTTNRESVKLPPTLDLDEFEERRKQLEIKNAQAKEELQKALRFRSEKNKEEVKKLSQIEAELKALDATLSYDISIIRNKIEKASFSFTDAQKRFDKAEKEYNIALANLVKEKEKKQLLTSHLCSIIEQNEINKAEKLTDLWEKLEITSAEDKNQWGGYEEPKLETEEREEESPVHFV